MNMLRCVFVLFAVTALAQASPPDKAVFQIKNGTVVLHLQMEDEAPERIYFTFTGKDGVFATGWGSDVYQLFLGDHFLPGEQASPWTWIDRGFGPLMGKVSLSETLTYDWVVYHNTGVLINGASVTLPTEYGLSHVRLMTPVTFEGEIRGCPIDIQTDFEHPDQCLEPYLPFVLKVHKEGRAIMDFVWDTDHYTGIRAAYFIDPDKKDPVVPW